MGKLILNKKMGVLLLVLLIVVSSIYAYKMNPPDEVVHQHITKEAGDVWSTIPSEIISHLTQPIDEQDIDGSYTESEDDDIIRLLDRRSYSLNFGKSQPKGI